MDATGSLCGISAMYWALFETVKTKSGKSIGCKADPIPSKIKKLNGLNFGN